MSNKEEKKGRLAKLAEDVFDQESQNAGKYPMSTSETIPPRRSYKEIAETLRIDIPICNLIPVNGRIFVIEKAAGETKTAAGIILERKMNIKKDDKAEGLKRYFVVAWDKTGIPENISSQLMIGIEVNPFLPQEAEEWSLPRVIDWSTGNEFKSIDYMELAGISKVKPEKDEEARHS